MVNKNIQKNKEYLHNVAIAGDKIEISRKDVDIDLIDLDPENPRIGYWTDNQIKKEFTQDEIAFALREKSDDINRLKLNIEVHEGIMNPIWVYRKGNRFSVIDGNTRLEIFRDLNKKYPQKECYEKIPCEILPQKTNDRTKNFIRLLQHLRGINDWEVYERARMLYILWEKKGYTEEDLQSQTKLNRSQIKKWIEAYKNMTNQFLSKYGTQSDALSKFSYFVEYENPKIKQGMDDVKLSIKDFCSWVGTGEIRRAQDVRNLRKIFEDKKAKEKLVQCGYKCAVDELSLVKPGVSSKLFEVVEDVIHRLKGMPRSEEEEIIEGDNSQKQKLLQELSSETNKIVKKFKK